MQRRICTSGGTDLKRQFRIADGLGKQFGGATGAAGESLQGVGSQLEAARDAAAASASDLSAQISQSASSALEALPEPIRDAVTAASGPLTKVRSLGERYGLTSRI